MRFGTWAFAAVAFVTLALLTPDDADAHGARRHVSVGVGYGYGGFYRPYRYSRAYAWPRAHIGFGIWPRYRPYRERREAVRNETLYVYPAAGQSETQLADDRYDCHVWSVDSTDYDPTLGAGSRRDAQRYARAFTACMEGRDYVVR